MTSWRSSTSQSAQDDLDAVVDVALNAARQQLASAGGFYPFAVGLGEDGRAELIGSAPPANEESPDSVTVAAAMWEALHEQRDTLRAGAVVTDRTGTDGHDQVAVQTEHREGPALEIVLPYRLQDDGFVGGQLSAGEGTPRVWA